MPLDLQQLRIEGIYAQKQTGRFMLRVKVPAGVISAEQAQKVADIAERFAGGAIHLTSRASIEFHWLREEDLVAAGRMLAAVGLTSRGACGGAVRGVVCSTPFAASFPALQVLARRLHNHFTGNPHFEGLPKKFKIGVDDGYGEARHLIQDVGLVRVGSGAGQDCYDVWVAGGLGREPVPAFLLEQEVAEGRLIPLIEAVLRVYRQHTPAGKRLKHLVGEIGRERFLKLLGEELEKGMPGTLPDGLDKSLTASPAAHSAVRLEAGVFAGELPAASLRRLAEIAVAHAGGFLVLTCDQNVVFHLPEPAAPAPVSAALTAAGFSGESREERVRFRVCPGTHECRLGLAPTRDVAREVIAAIGPQGEGLTWAIAGCPNSCSQPQLAAVGIIATKIVTDADGNRLPLFDLYRRSDGEAFGCGVSRGLSLAELLESISKLD
jgi:sulfite reductase beta subunit-like hemoprotein